MQWDGFRRLESLSSIGKKTENFNERKRINE